MPKYNNVPSIVDGIQFQSIKEASRYSELALLQRAGAISNLRLQVPYQLVVNGLRICKYIADFVYVEYGVDVVEDCKGMRTREYKLKAKLMLACHSIKILET